MVTVREVRGGRGEEGYEVVMVREDTRWSQ